MAQTIVIQDIGPHSNFQMEVKPGVNVVRGRHELGKSTVIRCVASLATGDGKSLPIRDGAACGMVSGFGTTISVGMRTQKAGAFKDVEPLSDRVDLSLLVEPPIKDPAAANKHRVRALLTLMKTKLTFEDFRRILPEDRQNEITDDFDATDPVELQGAIKRAMETEKRDHAEDADKAAETAKRLLASTEGIDLDAECDEAALRAAYQKAVEEKSRIAAEIKAAAAAKERFDEATSKLAAVDRTDLSAAYEEYSVRCAAYENARRANSIAFEAVERAKRALEEAKRASIAALAAEDSARMSAQDQKAVCDAAEKELAATKDLQSIVDAGVTEGPSQGELELATTAVQDAEAALTKGSEIRQAKQKREESKQYLQKQAAEYKLSEIYRTAAAATDVVLTEAVKSTFFTIKGGELYADDHAGVSRPYADLSEGARYRIAIRAVAESATEGIHFLPLCQEAFDGLNTAARSEIAKAAVDHGVIIVTGEKSDGELEVYWIGADGMAD